MALFVCEYGPCRSRCHNQTAFLALDDVDLALEFTLPGLQLVSSKVKFSVAKYLSVGISLQPMESFVRHQSQQSKLRYIYFGSRKYSSGSGNSMFRRSVFYFKNLEAG